MDRRGRTNEGGRDLEGPLVGTSSLANVGAGSVAAIRGEGTVDVGLEVREVDLNELIVGEAIISGEIAAESLGSLSETTATKESERWKSRSKWNRTQWHEGSRPCAQSRGRWRW